MSVSLRVAPIHHSRGRDAGGLTDLRETVGAGLKDDQQHPDGDGDLLQLQVVGHASPPQHPAHAVPRRDRDLPQADGQAVELGGGQAQAVQQLQREAACGREGRAQKTTQ